MRENKEYTFFKKSARELLLRKMKEFSCVAEQDHARIAKAILTLLDPTLGREQLDNFSIERMSPHSTFTITYKVNLTKSYVLRLFLNYIELKDAINTEFNIAKHVSELQIAPKIHYDSLRHGILVMEYISSEKNWQVNIDQAKKVAVLNFLKKLREFPVEKLYSSLSKNEKLDQIYNKARKACHETYSDNSFFEEYSEILLAFKELQDIVKAFPEKQLCHGDLHMLNMLYNPETESILGIDWEYYRIENQLFEVAYFIMLTHLNEQKEEEILSNYLGHEITETDWAMYLVMKQYIHAHRAIFFLGLCKDYDFVEKLDLKSIEILPPFKNFSVNTLSEQNIDLTTNHGLFMLGYMSIKDFKEFASRSDYLEILSTAKQAIETPSLVL